MSLNYPLLFGPVLKDYIWGGRGLETKLGRVLPPAGIIAESWEIAAHADGTTAVVNGPLAGQLLTDLVQEHGLDLIGTRSMWALKYDKFPLLIKLLDANHSLSVQVHPNDAYAMAHEGNELGKTEMWVVLHAEPGAEVILGVTAGTTAENFRAALEAGQLEPHLHHLPVRTGDHICVPAGSLHAIMGGLLIAEIQQNSNTTYRVYDWNRVGADGRPRPLHIEQALAVTNFEQVAPTLPAPIPLAAGAGIGRWQLCQNRYFTVERWEMGEAAVFEGECMGQTFEIWGVMAGSADIVCATGRTPLTAVQFALLPAELGPFRIIPTTPQTMLLRVFV